MRRENNQWMNSAGDYGKGISNSRAMGIIVLIALLFVYQVVTFVLYKVGRADAESVAETAPQDGDSRGVSRGNAERFMFNPNTITKDSLLLLGFSDKQAQSILKYRIKGGKFRKKSDFARLYVVDSAKYLSLQKYILLPDRIATERARDGGSVSKSGGNATERARDGGSVSKSGGNATESTEKGIGRSGESVYGSKVERNRYVCNLNTADSAALVRLYGIGGYYARKILEYRERLGGSFADKRQLLEIEGFTSERYSRIEDNIEVRREDIKGFSILDADRRRLERHPYIGAYAARGILMYIKLKGRDSFRDELQLLEHLVEERIIGENNAQRLREYLLHL